MTLGDQAGWSAGSASRPDEGARTATGGRRSTGTLRLVPEVAELQPANAFRPHEEPARPAGEPPGVVVGAAALCGVLAVPMLATAGSLFGGASRGSDVMDLSLSVISLLMAVGAVVGGVRMIRRGSPMVALLAAAFAVVATVGNLLRLIQPSAVDVVMCAVWAVFGFLTLIMIALLRTKRARRWFNARNREWQARHPGQRRRIRVRLPGRPANRSERTVRPRKVKRVGRHVRRSRWRSRRSGPVSVVGRPD